jgi:hypothetical protein
MLHALMSLAVEIVYISFGMVQEQYKSVNPVPSQLAHEM